MSRTAIFAPWALAGGTEQWLQLPGGAVRVHRLAASGAARPPGPGRTLIFLHGWGMGAAAFAPQAGLAQLGYDLLAPDLPGFAGTGAAPGRASIQSSADMVLALIDALQLDAPVLVGWSMGASIGWLAAAAAPEHIGGVISLDMSPCVSDRPGWDAGLAGGYGPDDCARSVQAMRTDWPGICAAFLPRVTRLPLPEAPLLAALAASADPDSAAAAWESLAIADLRPTLAALTCPLLAVHGGASALYPAATLAALQALNPRLVTRVIEGVGHAPHLEAPAPVNAAIARFAGQLADRTRPAPTAPIPPASTGPTVRAGDTPDPPGSGPHTHRPITPSDTQQTTLEDTMSATDKTASAARPGSQHRTLARSLLLAATALPALLVSLPGLAFAQQADTQVSSAEPLEEVVIVSARRRDEQLQDVPIAVSSISARALDATGAPDITALQQVTPNATVQVARGSNSTLIAFVRGVGQQDPLWGFEPGVGLYVDDVYIARPQGAVLDIFDISRIEVLRGPQGTLYGRNTIGGAIKYVTRPLATEPTARARLSVGSYGQLDVVVAGSTPLSDTFRVGGAFASYDRDGFGRNITTGAEHYDKNVTAARLSAEWTPSDALTFTLSWDKVEDESNARHGHRVAPGAGLTTGVALLPNVYDTDAGIGSANSVINEGLSFTASWAVNDSLTLKSITAQREGSSRSVIDFDTNQVPALDVPARYDDEQFSQEFQALFNMGRISGVAGLYYLDATASGAFDTILGAAALTIATSGQVVTESIAAYADVSFQATDQLSLSVGGRFTRDERQGTVYRQNFTGLRSPLFGNPAAVPGLLRSNYTNSREFEEFSPRVSASWKFNDDLTAYAAYSEGFKSGGFDMRGDAVLTPNTVNGYNPEYVNSFEIGLKGNLFGGRVNFAGAIFRAEYEGQQITRQEPTVTGGIASFVDNAGSSTIQGVELEGGARLTDNLSMTFGIGYTDAQFNEFRTNTVVSGVLVPIDLSATAVFQNTPEWNGNVAFTYRRNLGARGSMDATLTTSYRSEYTMFEFVNPLLDQTDPVTLVDLGIGWSSPDGGLRVALTGRNLTDERYKIGGYSFAGALFGNVQNSFYGAPRTWTLSAQFSF